MYIYKTKLRFSDSDLVARGKNEFSSKNGGCCLYYIEFITICYVQWLAYVKRERFSYQNDNFSREDQILFTSITSPAFLLLPAVFFASFCVSCLSSPASVALLLRKLFQVVKNS